MSKIHSLYSTVIYLHADICSVSMQILFFAKLMPYQSSLKRVESGTRDTVYVVTLFALLTITYSFIYTE